MVQIFLFEVNQSVNISGKSVPKDDDSICILFTAGSYLKEILYWKTAANCILTQLSKKHIISTTIYMTKLSGDSILNLIILILST